MNQDEEMIGGLLEGCLTAEEEQLLGERLATQEEFRKDTASLLCTERLLRFSAYWEREKPDLVIATRRRLECESERDSSQFVEAVQARLSKEIHQPITMPVEGNSRSGRSRAISSRRSPVIPSRPSRRSTWAGFLVASLALAAFAFYFLPKKVAPTAWQAKVTAVSGAVRIERAGTNLVPSVGQELLPKDLLKIEAQGRLAVTYADGTRVELNEDSLYQLGAENSFIRPTLERGTAFIHAAKQAPESKIVLNPGRFDQVEIMGTQFEVTAQSGSSALKMVEGRVRYGAGGRAIDVGGGQASEVRSGEAPTSAHPCDVNTVAQWRNAPADLPALIAPSALFGNYVSQYSDVFSFSWKDNSKNEEGFRLEKTEVTPGNSPNKEKELKFEHLTTLPANSTNYSFKISRTPTKDTTYRFRVYAFNTKTNQASASAFFQIILHPNGTMEPLHKIFSEPKP